MKPRIINEKQYKSVISVPEAGIVDESASMDEYHAYCSDLQKDSRVRGVLIPADCLHRRIAFLTDDISKDYPRDSVINIVLVLTGSFVFAADLSRKLHERHGLNVRFHLIKTSVYDSTIKRSGERYRAVKLELEPKEIEGRDVLVVEDITDQGFTMSWMKNYLLVERNVSGLRICSLLDKKLSNPSAEVKKIRDQLQVDYTGFEIPDVWVAGYGIDAGHEMRNLPCIVSINEKKFS